MAYPYRWARREVKGIAARIWASEWFSMTTTSSFVATTAPPEGAASEVGAGVDPPEDGRTDDPVLVALVGPEPVAGAAPALDPVVPPPPVPPGPALQPPVATRAARATSTSTRLRGRNPGGRVMARRLRPARSA
ncbi:hypothetical protein GCM10027517_06310 [Phycicoccus ginsengisoli]